MTQNKKLVMLSMIGFITLGLITFILSNDKPEQIIQNTEIKVMRDQPIVQSNESVVDVEKTIIPHEKVVKQDDGPPQTYEITFEAMHEQDIPELYRNELKKHIFEEDKTVKYFQADFSSLVNGKLGDTISIDLDGTVYEGKVVRYIDSNIQDNFVNDDGSNSFFYTIDTENDVRMDIGLHYGPNENIQYSILHASIGQSGYREGYYFSVFDTYGVYMEQKSYDTIWSTKWVID